MSAITNPLPVFLHNLQRRFPSNSNAVELHRRPTPPLQIYPCCLERVGFLIRGSWRRPRRPPTKTLETPLYEAAIESIEACT